MDLRGNAVTWLGHGTWLWETSEGKRLLIDCWLEGNPACPDDMKDPAALNLDGILITHGHFDHIGQGGVEAIAVITKSGAPGLRPVRGRRLPRRQGRRGDRLQQGRHGRGRRRTGDHGPRRPLGGDHRRRRHDGLRRRRRPGTSWSSRTAWSSTTPATRTCSATWRSSPRSTSRTSASCRSAASTPWARARRPTPCGCSAPPRSSAATSGRSRRSRARRRRCATWSAGGVDIPDISPGDRLS